MERTTLLFRRLWRMLGSIQLAASLMGLLMLVALVAIWFPQMPADPLAQEAWRSAVALRYGGTTALWHALGLFDAYQTPWYLALLAALVLNTVVCTIQRLPRLWRAIARPPAVMRPEAFFQGFAQRSEWPVSSLPADLAAVQDLLVRHHYHVLVQHDDAVPCVALYAERGRLARAGTLLSHLAVPVLVIAVAAHPALSWQETGLVWMPEQAYPVARRPGISARAGAPVVDPDPGGYPGSFEVPLTILRDGSPILTATVRLNKPLTIGWLSFHLQGYRPAARISTPTGTYDLAFPSSGPQEVALPRAGPTLRLGYQPEDDQLFLEALSNDGRVLGSGTVADGDRITLQGIPISIRLTDCTIWQIGHDWTFGLAVGSAAFVLLGTLSLWVPQRRLWLRVDERRAQMVGTGDFSGDFEALAGEIDAALARPCCGLGEPVRRDP